MHRVGYHIIKNLILGYSRINRIKYIETEKLIEFQQNINRIESEWNSMVLEQNTNRVEYEYSRI